MKAFHGNSTYFAPFFTHKSSRTNVRSDIASEKTHKICTISLKSGHPSRDMSFPICKGFDYFIAFLQIFK